MPFRHALKACALAVTCLAVSRRRPLGQAAQAPPVTDVVLDNGLRILVLEDHRSPIATIQTWYKVGSRNEIPGATGLAHFLEHMMFKGTPTHGKGQFARIVEGNGGQDNAFTSHDVTSYYVNIAADRVDLVLGLEADRMRNLLLDPKEIDSERQVVAEERRTRTEDDPDGYLSEEFLAAAYKAHPYGWPVIGWMKDIQRISQPELRAFYNRHYQPNNALLVVAGDVDTRRVISRARETFGRLPRGPAPHAMDAVEPPQLAERRVLVYKADARAPIVYIGFHVPNYTSKDAPALELLSTILQEGRASRLYRRLVYERRLALHRGRLRLPLARPQPVLVLGHAAARPDARGARAGHHGRDRAREERARARGGARARQEPDRVGLRLAPGLGLLAGREPGPLRAGGLVAETARASCP